LVVVVDLLVLLFGILCAALGGELFVRGAVGIATWARIPAGIVGVTIAAFATSSPEMSVAINAAVGGQLELALGDALGSKVLNVALVFAIALLVAPPDRTVLACAAICPSPSSHRCSPACSCSTAA